MEMLNQISVMGRLTADPELKHTQNDIAVVSFTIAVERDYTIKGQEKQTDFFDCVAWRHTAEFLCKYFSKGRMVVLNGSLQTRMWEDRDGNNRKSVEIVAANIYFGDSKKNSSDSTQDDTSSGYGTPPPPQTSFADNHYEEIINDDDLPF